MRWILAVSLSVLLAACIPLEGNYRTDWSRRELVEWYSRNYTRAKGYEKFGYAGSDDRYHYFIARPVDAFIAPRIPRAQLDLADVRPRSALGRRELYFYLVDPLHGFAKVEETGGR